MRYLIKNTGDFPLWLTDNTHDFSIYPGEHFWYEGDCLPDCLKEQFETGNIDYHMWVGDPERAVCSGVDWRREGF